MPLRQSQGKPKTDKQMIEIFPDKMLSVSLIN